MICCLAPADARYFDSWINDVSSCFTFDVTGVGLAKPAVAGGFRAIGGVPLGSSGLFRRGGNSRTHARPAGAGSPLRQGGFRLAALTLVEINLCAFGALVVGLT